MLQEIVFDGRTCFLIVCMNIVILLNLLSCLFSVMEEKCNVHVCMCLNLSDKLNHIASASRVLLLLYL